jgi:predicted Zn-dependent protease
VSSGRTAGREGLPCAGTSSLDTKGRLAFAGVGATDAGSVTADFRFLLGATASSGTSLDHLATNPSARDTMSVVLRESKRDGLMDVGERQRQLFVCTFSEFFSATTAG